MERIDIFKIIIEINRTIKTANIFVKAKLALPQSVIIDLDKLGEMAKDVDAYVLMTKDNEAINEVAKIERHVLNQISSWYENVSLQTKQSLLNCAKSLYNIANTDVTSTSTQRVPDTKKPQPTHFNRHFTTDEQKKLFEGLTKGGFLPKDADYRHFCYVFGGTAILNNEKPFEPLIWGKSVGLLAYMIDTLFSDTDGTNLWETTTKCFVWKSKEPNKDSMKNKVSKYKSDYNDKPKGHTEIDKIILS
ncbi:hypothetical protein FACS1894182_03370 [Bacteroidia bacterium]|nr:hypothetical protein FACS1894182_03370 [Bacteroidia bacterium]